MKVEISTDDTFDTSIKDIVFPVNIEGINNFGIAARITSLYGSKIILSNRQELGKVIPMKIGKITFYAVTCYSLYKGKMYDQAFIVKKCIDSIKTNSDLIAYINMNKKPTKYNSDYDQESVKLGLECSNKDIIVYNQNVFNKDKLSTITKTRKTK